MKIHSRPKIDVEKFEFALEHANLDDIELRIIDYIRYVGVFTQPLLIKELKLKTKPPALTLLCISCRKIGSVIPEHFKKVREWSASVSQEGVRWDGDLICSSTFNIDGNRLIPEEGTVLFHQFAVHRELFTGLN